MGAYAAAHLAADNARVIERASIAMVDTPLHVFPAANAGAAGAARRVVPVATRAKKLRVVIDHASPADAADLLGNVLDVWDLVGPVPEDDAAPGRGIEEQLSEKFRAAGLDFHDDVIPAFRKEPVVGIEGAHRVLLTDDHALVPVLRLPKQPASAPFDRALKAGIARTLAAGVVPGNVRRSLFVTRPLPAGIEAQRGTALVQALAMSPELEWHSVTCGAQMSLPSVLEVEGRRYDALVPIEHGAQVDEIVLVAAATDAGLSASPK